MKNIIVPNKEEINTLKSIAAKNNRLKIRQRAKIILYRLEGFTYRKIASFIHCSRETIKKCIQSWNEGGLGSILQWRRTDSWKKQCNRRNTIEKLLEHKPTKLGFPFSSWSLRTIKAFFVNWLGYNLSLSTIQRDLKLIKYKHKLVEEKLIIKPPNYDEIRAQLSFLKRYKPERWRLIYIDEKGPLPVIRYSGRIWTKQTIVNDIRQRNLGKVLFLGGFDPVDFKLSMQYMSDINSEAFCQTLKKLIPQFLHKPYTKLILVMDNAFIHKSKKALEFFKKNTKIDVFFLPTYSPELNPIELCFNNYQRELVNNNTFTSGIDLIRKTYSYVKYYNSDRRGAMAC